MKTSCFIATVLVLTTLGIQGQVVATRNPMSVSKGATATDTPLYSISETGPHHRVWQKTVSTTNQLGQVTTITTNQAYVELATGLNYRDPVTRQWTEAKEEIESYPGGAVARQGQHQVIFANDLATAGAIDMQTPDGKRMRSHILGLSYFDTASGQSVLIAEVTNCQGIVVPPNQVLYQNAFTEFKADVLYTYTRGGFEQDVILRERPPLPEVYGLDSKTTHLQILTEFLSPPQPAVSASALASGAGESLRDETLDFGVMSIGRGKAFILGNNENQPVEEIPVAKQWLLLEGRQVLVEEVTIPAAAKQLDTLPLPKQAGLGRTKKSVRRTASIRRQLPALKLVQTASTNRMQMAKLSAPLKGFVLDYVTLNTSLTNYTFQGDTTYYISGAVLANSTSVTFEGGAVIKYTNGASLKFQNILTGNQVQMLTSAYRPVIFTAMDDNSVGESISGSTGNPTNYYANPALSFSSSTKIGTFSNFRIAYAWQAIVTTFVTITNYNAQIVNCQNGVSLNDNGVYLRNVLFANVRTNFSGSFFGQIDAQNSTFNGITNLAIEYTPGNSITLTMENCIFANVLSLTNSGMILSGTTNGFYNCTPFGTGTVTNTFNPFQSVGAGNYYLTNGCSFFNAGNTNIDPTLLAAIKQKTTYPPIAYTNTTFSIATTLNPQAQRDTDTPDLGYHFEPLDYLVDSLVITNAALNVINGTAIACYNEPGIQLKKGSTLISTGTPLSPNWFVRYQSVQEQSIQLGGTNVSAGQTVSATGNPTAVFQFSKFTCPAFGGYHLYDAAASTYTNLVVQNCEFWGGQNYLTGSTNTTATLVNNLFWRSTLTASNANNASLSSTLTLTNNLVYGAAVNLSQPSNTVWYAFNNAFDTCALTNSTLTNGYNAYLSCTGRLNPTNANDIVTNALAYQTGTLGSFYQPTNSPLINKGSTNASLVGLYHFTTQTNQVKEINSLVDMGYHYVAVTNNVPIDTDGDGIPDYLEDANGNGSVDSGETDWQSATDLGLKVFITRPKNNSVIP